MFKTTKIEHDANVGKIIGISELLSEWQKALHCYTCQHKKNLQMNKHNPKYENTKTTDVWFTTPLSARQLKSNYNQAHKAWNSYEALLVKAVRSRITNSNLSENDKTIYYRINRRKAWYDPKLELDWVVDPATGEMSVPSAKDRKDPQKIIQLVPVDPEHLKIMRNIVKHVSIKPPNLRKTRTMEMADNICHRADKKKEKNKYGRWLHISTYTKYKTIKIPLLDNKYYEQIEGKESDLTQIIVNEDNTVRIHFIKECPNVEKRKTEGVRSLDSNISDNLFATDDGRLLGAKFVEWLREKDAQIIKREQYLKKNKIPLKNDKHYNSLVKKMRDYTKNEVNRIINLVLEDTDISEIVVEKLNLSSPRLSKTTNRLIARMGRRVLRAKLARVQESHGVSVSEYNPAYSSQECSRCSFVSRENRKKRSTFECQCCGNKLHADINAARVLLRRRSYSSSGCSDPFTMVRKNNVRDLVMKQHELSFHARSRVPIKLCYRHRELLLSVLAGLMMEKLGTQKQSLYNEV